MLDTRNMVVRLAPLPVKDSPVGHMLDVEALRTLIAPYAQSAEAILENVHAFPGQGVTSMFTFGRTFGQLLAFLDLGPIPYTLIDPKEWRARTGLGTVNLSKRRKSVVIEGDGVRRSDPKGKRVVMEAARALTGHTLKSGPSDALFMALSTRPVPQDKTIHVAGLLKGTCFKACSACRQVSQAK